MLSKMASRECIRHVSTVFYIYFWACLVVTTPGVQAFKFLSGPPNPPILTGHFALNVDINCTTDDPNATVTLLHGDGFPLSERPLVPKKLVLNQQVFTVLNLIVTDGGRYACKATNQSGNSIQWPRNAMLVLLPITLPKHFVLIPAKAVIVLQGQSGSVTCETEGASTAAVKLKWLKKKTDSDTYQAVPDSQVKVIRDDSANMLRAILQITNAKLSDGGTYKCTVTVKHLSKSRLMNIRIDAPEAPEIVKNVVTNLVIKEGAEKTVKCEAKGSPKPDVTWYREGKQINKTDCRNYPKVCEGIAYEVYEEGETSSQHTSWTSGVLKIRSTLYPRDQGEFKCVASNGNPPLSELSFTFDVQVPPRIVKLNNQPTQQHQQEEGKETQVSCSIEKSNPLPKFEWYSQIMEDCPDSSTDCKPDEDKWNLVSDLLMSPSAATRTNKSIVTIKSNHEENTFYRCQASSSLGNDSLLIRFFRLAKGKKPIELDTATKKEFYERSTLEMYCIDRSSGWSVVFFTKDNKRLSPGVDPRVNITRIQRSGEVKDDRLVLIVKNLTLNDSGNYRCGLELDPSTFGSINITVKSTQASRSSEGCFNSTRDLGMARGTIPDSDITASSILNTNSHPHFARLENPKAWIADGKDYHPWIQVNLQKAINITAIATQGFYNKSEGISSYIRQYYLSYSDSGNEWMNYTTQGITKVFQGNLNDGKVVTVDLNPLVVAQYIRLHPTNCSTYCALRMELYGCNSTTGVPGRPPLPTVSSISTTSIIIQWNAPDEVGDGITGYNVRWQENGTSTVKQKVIRGSRVATLDSLIPYTWYNIQVQAYDKKGDGPWSLVLKVRSAESVPSAAPANFKLSSNAPLTLDVSWDAIPVSQRQGILLGYIINYTKNGSGVSQTKEVRPDQLKYKIEGLEFARYFVKVAGFTVVGNGKFTDPLIKFPNEGVPSVAPANFKLGSSASLSLDVSWDAIPVKQQQGLLLGYIINYTKNGSGVSQTKKVRLDQLKYKIEGLEFARYFVKVAGYTAVGNGKFTDSLNRFPNEGAPTPPRNLQLSVRSSTSISVSWEEPETKNGNLKRYVVSYGTQRGTLNKLRYTNSTEYLLEPLEEYTWYFVQVHAETDVSGNPSEIQQAMTLEDAPSSDPDIIEADTMAEDAHSIRVAWQKIIQKDQNGNITGYTVYYNVKDHEAEFSKNTSAHETSTLLNGLKPYTTYCIKVAGYTKVGRSPLKETPYCVQTLQAGPSKPRNVRVQATSSTSIDVTWDEPAILNGVLQEFIISYGTRKDIQEVSVTVTGQTFKRKIPGLRKFTTYYIKVRGQTTKPGNASRVLNATTFEDRPGAPTKFSGQVISATIVLLSWSAPVSPNGIIRKYLIKTYDTVTSREVKSDEVDASTKQTRVSSLKPFTYYTFTLQAVTTEAGEMANFSARTEEGVPSKPRDVRAQLEDDSISVLWDEPGDPNGILIHYEVYCKGTRSYNSSFQINLQIRTLETSRFAVIKKANVKPGTKYTIHLIASTSKGEGERSDPAVVDTPSEAPPPPPTPRVLEDEVTPSTITISLTPSSDVNGEVMGHQVVVEKLGKVSKRSAASLPNEIFGYEEAKRNGDKFYIAARFDREDLNNHRDFVVGDGKKYGDYENKPLEPETKYKVYVRGVTIVDGKWIYGDATPTKVIQTGDGPVVNKSRSDRNVAIIAGILGALILIVIIAIATLLYKRSNRPRNPNLDVENQKRKRREFDMRRSSGKRRVLAVPGEVINDADHPPIPVEQLAKHVAKLHKSDDRGYMIEYNKLDSGQEYEASAALLPENKAKNRYANIIAYDHSRVVQSTIDGIVGSDYINASRIDGYNKPNAYIATQGPVPPAFDDFWRMVWENQSSSIVMLTNLQERHKLKCHKYWPDETQEYGDISVMLVKSEHYSDYIIRTFNVKRESEKEEREVKQFHFTVWPDHGVPEYPTALLAFRRRVRAYNPADAGPIVVHCSAGVGRTGTFMVTDSMLDRIKAENTIDIFNYVAYLRTRRTAMVQTEEQYTFCHDAILEAVQCGNTQIYAHDLRITLARMDDVTKESKMSRFESEFKTLNKVSPVLTKGSYLVASYPENKEKNRSPDILAPDFNRVMLTAIDDNEPTSYINAVHISGYKQQHAFIVTHHPLTPTVTDFWRMLCEQECSCVVLFDSTEEDGDFPLFWPEDESTYDDMITVQRLSASSSSVDNLKANYDQSQIAEKTFKTTDLRTPEKSLRIKMFHYSGWIEEDKIPSCSGLITLIAKVEKWQQRSGNGPITVVCSDGIGRSGTFCALYSVLERLKIEQVIDVFQAIKAMRIPRPGLVKSAAEYRFIHFAIQEYLSAFDDYANFKP